MLLLVFNYSNLFIWKTNLCGIIIIIELNNPFPTFKVIGGQPSSVPNPIIIEHFYIFLFTFISVYFAFLPWMDTSIKMLIFIRGTE